MADVAHTCAADRHEGEQGKPPQQRQQAGGGRQEGPPFWEWVVAALGALLVAGSVAFLGWQAATGRSGEPVPAPTLHLLSVEAQEGRYLVRIRVVNQGQGTAEGLRVRGELKQGEKVVESSETELRYLPGGSSREAGLFFEHDPLQLQLELSPSGYQKP